MYDGLPNPSNSRTVDGLGSSSHERYSRTERTHFMRTPNHQCTLLRSDTGERLVNVVQVANSFWSRFVGLQFRKSMPAGHGILLVPCSSLHTMWVRFPIDVFLISIAGAIVEIRRNVRPWRVVFPRNKTHAVLETAVDQLDIEVGTSLTLRSNDDRPLPRSLQFLEAKE